MTDKKSESLARVVEAAIRAFSTQKFSDVHIGQIGQEARCSTATIYDAFGSKDGLFNYVRGQLTRNLPRQAPWESDLNASPMLAILDYLMEVFTALTSPTLPILLTPQNPGEGSGYAPFEHSGLDFEAVMADVAECMDAGFLRPADPRACTFLMFAGISYEPMLYLAMARKKDGQWLDPAAILRSIFQPLASDAGARIVESYVARLDRGEVAPEARPKFHELLHLGSCSPDRREQVIAALEQLRELSRSWNLGVVAVPTP
jgi:AcrR family transcriptional regulator